MAYEDVLKSLKIKSNLNVGGTITGTTAQPFAEFTATGTNTVNSGMITLNHATVPVVISVPAPGVAGKFLIIKDTSASGTAAHVVTATASTFDGTNNTATFNAPLEQLILYSVSATAWTIVLNSGSVSMSSV
jgi:hypothetical protein